MDNWLEEFERLLNMPRAEKRRLENLHNLFLARHVGLSCEPDSKHYDEMRTEQLAINRFNRKGRNEI